MSCLLRILLVLRVVADRTEAPIWNGPHLDKLGSRDVFGASPCLTGSGRQRRIVLTVSLPDLQWSRPRTGRRLYDGPDRSAPGIPRFGGFVGLEVRLRGGGTPWLIFDLRLV
eukprot:CAMPEP_0181418010 /NCGR_PEP_ID=MMETSP1110-20121109/11335_1 /TAXON_ID=174948 /ORGANISM="Symbiodinium sp., Strain CCMP421" /LENGTH=111 /DNA_ID=CAMNT_0023540977 /DNA_START=407 /DNA_END=742 /DNA_ORIENTATION=-